MVQVIYHHHDPCPFAEKIRKIFGMKSMDWQSVQIPLWMPKPDLTLLTGGYRRTPVLQIGADIYCDTQLIAQILNRNFPTPDLFASGPLNNIGLQLWADITVFQPGSGLALYENAANLPKPLADDRRALFTYMDFDKFQDNAPHYRNQFRAAIRLVDDQLKDGRAFLMGDDPEWIDISGYYNIWMARGHIPSAAAMMDGCNPLLAWMQRMDDFGEGQRIEIDAAQAHAIARGAQPAEKLDHIGDHLDVKPGDAVAVAADDYGKEPVIGALLAANDRMISVLREDPALGEIAVHFPRFGYRITHA